MIEVIPAIMPISLLDLQEKCARVLKKVPTVQIDIMDGVFVEKKTWPYLESRNEFNKMTWKESALPFHGELAYEVDLMIKNPEREIENWISAGISRLIIHIESTEHLAEIMMTYGKKAGEKINPNVPHMPEIGLAISLNTPTEKLYPWISHINFVQCMGIADIGFQGNPFDDRVIQKIIDIKQNYPDIPVSVDGGVSLTSAPQLLTAGANRLVSGSAIFNSENIEDTLIRLKTVSE